MSTLEFAEVEDTRAFFVLCRACELNPAHPWDRRQSDLYETREDADVARRNHDAKYHPVSSR